MRFCHNCFKKITPQAGSGSLVWIHNLKMSFIQQMPFFMSPNGIPAETSFSVALHKPLWKENLIKDILTQINAHATSVIKPRACYIGLGNKYLMKACGTGARGQAYQAEWPNILDLLNEHWVAIHSYQHVPCFFFPKVIGIYMTEVSLGT